MAINKNANYRSITVQAAKDKGRRVELKGGVTSLSYYENLRSNHTTGSIDLVDTGNSIVKDGKRVSLIEGLPIRGGEKIVFKVEDNSNNTLSMEMYLNKMTNLLETTTKDSFTINYVSKEFFANEMARVIKRYDGKISESVSAILKLLKADIGEIENTSNSYNFIGNDKKPFYICSWLGTKSIPEEEYGKTAGFFLYQTQDGINFKSVDGLLKQKPIKKYMYNDSAGGAPRGYDGKVLSYSQDRTVDLQSNLMLGVYNNRTLFFDPYEFAYTPKTFNITDQSGVKHAGVDSKDDWDFIAPEFTDSPTRLMTSILDNGALPSGKNAKEQLDAWHKDKDATNDKVMERMVQSVMRYNQLFSVTTSITIDGDFTLKAGDMISIDVPEVSERTESIDKKRSGNYVISSLRHYLTPEKCETSLTLIRDSYGRKRT